MKFKINLTGSTEKWGAVDKASELTLLLFLFFASLWDFYLKGQGVRLFDLLLIVSLLFVLFIPLAQFRAFHVFYPREIQRITPVVAIVLISIPAAFFSDELAVRSAIGILFCLVVFTYFFGIKLNPTLICKCLDTLVVVHVFFLLFQFFVYTFQGSLINPFSFLDLEIRVFGSIFRPAGLFREPAHFAFQVFSMLAIRTRYGYGVDRTFFVGAIGIVVSKSLWGVAALSVLFILMFWRRKSTWVISSILICICWVYWTEIYSELQLTFLEERLKNIQFDGSAESRYSALLVEPGLILTDSIFWFGRGPNIENYVYFGGNGLGYMLSTWGLLGSICIFLLFTRGQPLSGKVFTFLIIGLALTATPLWTQLYWWIWIALLIGPNSFKHSSTMTPRRFNEFDHQPE